MRLWHKDLIPVLPRQQLLSQWRECCCIARNIAINGTPNHILVNKVLEYSPSHLWKYGYLVMSEMEKRNYSCDFGKFEKWFDKPYALMLPRYSELFEGWHNDRYLTQCYYNLQEKYDRGGIPEEEWLEVEEKYRKLMEVSYEDTHKQWLLLDSRAVRSHS